ncbi:MAG: hypothetical protein EBS06_08945 [Proteobacteria bacterium]|nr:hypothetical protein [Pseudomonadota bacterium]
MKIKFVLPLLLLLSASCVHQDLSKTLRYSYSNGEKIGVNNINYDSLKDMKRGESCLFRVLYLIPFGDDSIMTATANGKINKLAFGASPSLNHVL